MLLHYQVLTVWVQQVTSALPTDVRAFLQLVWCKDVFTLFSDLSSAMLGKTTGWNYYILLNRMMQNHAETEICVPKKTLLLNNDITINVWFLKNV